MQKLKVAHEIFSIEKIYQADSETVFSAWSNLDAKAQWFIGPGEWSVVKRELDFRVGGKEILHGRFPNGKETLYKAEYYNILPDKRIVFTYQMFLGENIHSISIASVEIESISSDETMLTFTEQVAFLDGTIGREGLLSRKEGTMALLDKITEFLRK